MFLPRIRRLRAKMQDSQWKTTFALILAPCILLGMLISITIARTVFDVDFKEVVGNLLWLCQQHIVAIVIVCGSVLLLLAIEYAWDKYRYRHPSNDMFRKWMMSPQVVRHIDEAAAQVRSRSFD